MLSEIKFWSFTKSRFINLRTSNNIQMHNFPRSLWIFFDFRIFRTQQSSAKIIKRKNVNSLIMKAESLRCAWLEERASVDRCEWKTSAENVAWKNWARQKKIASEWIIFYVQLFFPLRFDSALCCCRFVSLFSCFGRVSLLVYAADWNSTNCESWLNKETR